MVPRSLCMLVKPFLSPRVGLSGPQVPAPLADHQPEEPPHYVAVGLAELVTSVPGAEVVAPAAQNGVQVRDHVADVRSRAVSASPDPDLVPEPVHRPLRRPPVQVVA